MQAGRKESIQDPGKKNESRKKINKSQRTLRGSVLVK